MGACSRLALSALHGRRTGSRSRTSDSGTTSVGLERRLKVGATRRKRNHDALAYSAVFATKIAPPRAATESAKLTIASTFSKRAAQFATVAS